MPVLTSCAGCGKTPLEAEIDQLPAFCPDCQGKKEERQRWLALTADQKIDSLKARIEALEAREKARGDGKTTKRRREGAGGSGRRESGPPR